MSLDDNVKDLAVRAAQEDKSIRDALTAGLAAVSSGANEVQAYSLNASFDDWGATSHPAYFGSWSGSSPTKDLVNRRVGAHGLRLSSTVAGSQSGVTFNPLVHMPYTEYVTVELEFMLVSGELTGAGVILDWNGRTGGNRQTIDLDQVVSNPVLGKWYRVTTTLRDSSTGGTFTTLSGFLMGNWNTFGSAVKEITYDWMNIRPATQAEIAAYNAPGPGHTHTISEVGGLPTALAGKADTGHTHTAAEIGASPVGHTHTAAEVGAAAAAHTHTAAEVGAAPAVHTHTAANISDATATGRSVLTAASTTAARTAIGAGTSNLAIGTTVSTAAAGNHTHTPAAIGAAAASHTHTTANVTGLDTALSGKAPTVHTHTASQISDASATGRSVLTGADAAAIRQTLDVVSSQAMLGLGSTSTTAAPGDHTHPATDISSGVIDPARLPLASSALRGAVAIATQAEVDTGTDGARAITPATLSARLAAFSPSESLPRAVFVGNSNSTDTRPNTTDSWPTRLCAKRGWIQHNHAQDSLSFMSTTSYLNLAQNGINELTPAQRLEVGHVFVADGSSDARDSRTYAQVFARAGQVYQTVRDAYPNAKLVVLPMIWPADSKLHTPSSIYTGDTSARVIMIAKAMREALIPFTNSLYINESWTWLTGRMEWMIGTGDVHPNAEGHGAIAALVDRALNGEHPVGFEPWSNLTPWNADTTINHASIARARPFAATRKGWHVSAEGGIARIVAANTGLTILGTLDYGLRPPYTVIGTGIRTGSQGLIRCELWDDGTVRIYDTVPAGEGVLLNFQFSLG